MPHASASFRKRLNSCAALGMVGLCVLTLGGRLFAADWTTFRGDNARTGSTAESLTLPLQSRWVYAAPGAPKLAWSSGEGRVIEGKLLGHRIKYDDAIHPVVAGNRVYFGSSVDHQLHCVDLQSGASLWTFFANGPIRLAPTLWQDRVYFGCDDGNVYCLAAADGRLHWKLRAGPADEWLLARGEMISRWPVRTGVLVQDGIAYFGAGIFPHEDIYIYAVDATDGSIRWRQDNISALDAGRNDLSPQGHLLSSENLLFVPSGGSLPAALDRKTGNLLHKPSVPWRTTAGGVVGGVQALLADGQIYASGPHHMLALDQQSGSPGFGWFAGRQMVVQGDQAYVATGEAIARLNRQEYAVNSRQQQELNLRAQALATRLRTAGDQAKAVREELDQVQSQLREIANVGIDWRQSTPDDSSLLAAGNVVFLGGNDRVTAYAATDGKLLWQSKVQGEARGLVVANGHLLVSTNAGRIHCFAPGDMPPEIRLAPESPVATPTFPQDDRAAAYAQAAEQILKQLGQRNGFCLIVGNDQGRLAYELAQRSDLKIYATESNADKVEAARQTFSSAGLYGTRVVIHPFAADEIPYSNYFANAIVSDLLVQSGEWPGEPGTLVRHLKPVGGIMVVHREAKLEPALQEVAEQGEVTTSGNWAFVKRGKLPGAGDWSHQYGNPANTAVSSDSRIKGDLGVLWYGDPGPGEMVNRHEGAVGPLSTQGRLFVQGESSIMAYDAYNGAFLWKHENPEAIRTGVFQNNTPGNLAASDERLFHFLRDKCYELDAETGEVVRVHRLPEAYDDNEHQWGFVATQNGLLFGTATVRKDLEAQRRRRGLKTDDATTGIFAIDLKNGKHLWAYQGQVISHHTIAIGPKDIYFIDSSISSEERERILREDKTELAKLTGEERDLAEARAKKADLRRAVALDARTGEKLWENPVDVTDCSEIGIGGGKLTLIYHDGTLLLGGANANGHYWKQFIDGDFSRRRLVALSANGGYKLWAKDANYKGRPIIVGGQVLAEPWSFDLQTGEQRMRKHPLTGEQVPWSLMRTGHHCGIFTGCDSGMLMFRSGHTAFYDLEADEGVRHFAGHRLGCWINAIPAGGLVMVPEASAGCVCLFSISSTIVLEPREPRRPWTIYGAVGTQTPVRAMALNLGAPGDRKDSQGQIWLSYPRNKAYRETSLDVAFDLKPKFSVEGGFRSIGETSVPIVGTELPWLYSSWAEGLEQLTLPLRGPDDGQGAYTVRLHFAPPVEKNAAPVTFDIRLQGDVVQANVTLAPSDGKPSEVVIHEFKDVTVAENLTVELVAKQGAPRLHAIEVVARE